MRFIKCDDKIINMDMVCSITKADEKGLSSKIHYVCGKEEEVSANFADLVASFASYEKDDFTSVEPEEVSPYTEVESVEDIANLINGEEPEVSIEIKEALTLSANEAINIPAGKKVTVKLDNNMQITRTGFAVADGGELILKGEGTITTTNKQTRGAVVEANGKNAKVVLDGVTIDAITTQGKEGNYTYGCYLMNDASLEMKSGIIKTAYGSGISTNNTTGGNTVINIKGGEIYSDGSYAIYLAAQGTLNITGGKVQGVNARMGVVNIKGNAEIIPTTITADSYDNIGVEFKTSGCVWLGDTIAVMAGTYSDDKGTQCVINVSGDATVKSNFRSAIGIYEVDTKEAQKVRVNVYNPDNVKTTDGEFTDIKVYDHDYIAGEADAAGKTYTPVAQSEVKLIINGETN